MRVAVDRERHREPIDRILEPARSDERINFERLTLYRLLDRSVVQQCDARGGTQADQRGLELQGLVDRFVDELLDDRFTPGAQRARAEAATEALDAGNADARELDGIAIEHHD